MANYEYVKEPGILLDALFLLKLRFNGEGAYSKFRGEPGFDEYEEKYCELVKSKVDNISDRLLPLCYYDADNGVKTPLVWYMRDNWQLLMKNPAEIIDRFMDLIRDMPKLKEYIFFHYFPQKAVPAFKSMEYIRETILASEYPLDLKLYLLDFFIAPDGEASFIIEEFNKALNISLQACQENQITIDSTTLQSIGQNIDAFFEARNTDKKQYSNIFYTYCYITRKTISVESYGDNTIMAYFGINMDQSCFNIQRTAPIDFYEIGRCLYDETRLKILSMLRNREMYCAEIARELSLKNNSTIYHLNMMAKQNMLSSRTQGKKIFYSLNVSFLTQFNNYLKQIIEEESIRENELEKTTNRNNK